MKLLGKIFHKKTKKTNTTTYKPTEREIKNFAKRIAKDYYKAFEKLSKE